ncbi:two-component sensor histidine kinase [Enemella dayhoffiae]|uniref:Sensor-like histidine kinase SenX3 n=1 Tax=Enemella dayhoffiae TaxID=2016507 RepID=A0A255HAE0_9ACTN|nr:ATP-binding protein [Enemella dayhoffiae]OYO24432.1 two-component sensor histidine kinase [Enemella dayhoffiae]
MWILWVLVGVVLGLLVGLLVGRRSGSAEVTPSEPEPELEATQTPVVPEGVSQVINVLRSSAVVIGPHDQVLQSTSQARTFGLVRGTRVAVPILLDLVREVRRDGQIRTADLELRRGRGAPSLYLSARVAPVADLVLVLAEDRTAARRVEETRRDFVANVSHELKTPIGAIRLLSEAVEQAADEPDAVRNFASRMNRESGRLSELVGQIIELSRLQAANPLPTAESVDIDAVLSTAVARSAERARARGLTLTVAGEQGCRVMGDAEQLTTAVSNLVENAVIYSEPNHKVAVAARHTADADDEYVELTVSDSGIGIDAKDVPRIFERFYRVDYARSRENGGTGLGLSIVKHIAGAHGGTVSVWSKPGQGSTFTIRIPAHADPEYLAAIEAETGLVQMTQIERSETTGEVPR